MSEATDMNGIPLEDVSLEQRPSGVGEVKPRPSLRTQGSTRGLLRSMNRMMSWRGGTGASLGGNIAPGGDDSRETIESSLPPPSPVVDKSLSASKSMLPRSTESVTKTTKQGGSSTAATTNAEPSDSSSVNDEQSVRSASSHHETRSVGTAASHFTLSSLSGITEELLGSAIGGSGAVYDPKVKQYQMQIQEARRTIQTMRKTSRMATRNRRQTVSKLQGTLNSKARELWYKEIKMKRFLSTHVYKQACLGCTQDGDDNAQINLEAKTCRAEHLAWIMDRQKNIHNRIYHELIEYLSMTVPDIKTEQSLAEEIGQSQLDKFEKEKDASFREYEQYLSLQEGLLDKFRAVVGAEESETSEVAENPATATSSSNNGNDNIKPSVSSQSMASSEISMDLKDDENDGLSNDTNSVNKNNKGGGGIDMTTLSGASSTPIPDSIETRDNKQQAAGSLSNFFGRLRGRKSETSSVDSERRLRLESDEMSMDEMRRADEAMFGALDVDDGSDDDSDAENDSDMESDDDDDDDDHSESVQDERSPTRDEERNLSTKSFESLDLPKVPEDQELSHSMLNGGETDGATQRIDDEEYDSPSEVEEDGTGVVDDDNDEGSVENNDRSKDAVTFPAAALSNISAKAETDGKDVDSKVKNDDTHILTPSDVSHEPEDGGSNSASPDSSEHPSESTGSDAGKDDERQDEKSAAGVDTVEPTDDAALGDDTPGADVGESKNVDTKRNSDRGVDISGAGAIAPEEDDNEQDTTVRVGTEDGNGEDKLDDDEQGSDREEEDDDGDRETADKAGTPNEHDTVDQSKSNVDEEHDESMRRDDDKEDDLEKSSSSDKNDDERSANADESKRQGGDNDADHNDNDKTKDPEPSTSDATSPSSRRARRLAARVTTEGRDGAGRTSRRMVAARSAQDVLDRARTTRRRAQASSGTSTSAVAGENGSSGDSRSRSPKSVRGTTGRPTLASRARAGATTVRKGLSEERRAQLRREKVSGAGTVPGASAPVAPVSSSPSSTLVGKSATAKSSASGSSRRAAVGLSEERRAQLRANRAATTSRRGAERGATSKLSEERRAQLRNERRAKAAAAASASSSAGAGNAE